MKEWCSRFRERLKTVNLVIGFETLGGGEAWSMYSQERKKRPLKLVLVPNLEYLKGTTGWTRHTYENLSEIDVIVAKTPCIMDRLHKLFLCKRFEYGKGNLVLVPYISMSTLPDLGRMDTKLALPQQS